MVLLRNTSWQQLCLLISIILTVHNFKPVIIRKLIQFQYYPSSALSTVLPAKNRNNRNCDTHSAFEMLSLKRDIRDMQTRIEQLETQLVQLATHEDVDLKMDTFLADQIGIFDYGAEYAGATVTYSPDTIAYPSNHAYLLFGIVHWTVDSEPSTVIRPTRQPGDCFAFHGTRGRVKVTLARSIVITDVSLEHVKVDAADWLAAAPRDFQIWGNGVHFLGNFTYNLQGRTVQTFSTLPTNRTFDNVEMRILNNYGNIDFTCVYRLRIHSIFA